MKDLNELRNLLKQIKIPGVLEISEVMTFPPTRADEIRLRIKDVISIQITGGNKLTFNFRPYQTKTQNPDNERFVQLMTDVVHKTLGKKTRPSLTINLATRRTERKLMSGSGKG